MCLGEELKSSRDHNSESYKELMNKYLEESERRLKEGLDRRGVTGACAMFLDHGFIIPGLFLSSKEYMKVRTLDK